MGLLLVACAGDAAGQGLSRSMDESQKALREAINLDRQGKKARAKSAYRRAIRLNPRSLKAFDHYSLFLFSRGAFSEGVKVMTIGLKLNRDRPELRAFLGMHLYRLGRTEQAHAAFKAAPRMASRFDVQVVRAQCAMLLEDYAAAIIALRDYLNHRQAKLARGDHAFRTQLALALLRTGKLSAARKELALALRARPGYRQARLAVAELLLRKRRCRHAAVELGTLLGDAPAGSEVPLHLSAAHQCLGQHVKAHAMAERYLREHAAMLRAIRRGRGPDRQHRRHLLDALVRKGEALIRLGRPARAVEPLRLAFKLAGSEALALRVAQTYFLVKDYRGALTTLKGRIKRLDASPQTLILALRSAVRLRDHAMVEYCASRLLARRSPRAVDLYYAGMGFNSAGKFSRATATLQDALKRGAKHRGVLHELARAYCHQARRALRAGRPEEAARKLIRAVKVVPGSPAVRRNLALVYLKLGRGAEALAQAQHLAKLRPTGPIGWWLVGRALLVQGRHKESREYYRLAAIKARNDRVLVAKLQAEAGVAWLKAGALRKGVRRLTEAAGWLAEDQTQRSLARMIQRNITRARLQRGLEALQQGRPRRARALLESARSELLPPGERSVIAVSRALTSAAAGQAPRARAELKSLSAGSAQEALRPAYAKVAQELLLASVDLYSRDPTRRLRAAATLDRLAGQVGAKAGGPLRRQAGNIFTRLGARRYRAGNHKEARAALARASRLMGGASRAGAPSNKAASQALRHNRAVVNYYAGQPERSLKELTALTRKLPLAFCNLAVHHDRRGAHRRAYQLYSSCLKGGTRVFPDLKQILEIKRQILGATGDAEGAAEQP